MTRELIIAIATILQFAVEIYLIVIFYKRQKGIDQKTSEIIQILNRMELDEVGYKILEKEDRP